MQDGGSSRVATETSDDFADCGGRWRPRATPAHASWLDQAELLIRAFSPRHLKRRSWAGRDEVIAQVAASGPEYNRLGSCRAGGGSSYAQESP